MYTYIVRGIDIKCLTLDCTRSFSPLLFRIATGGSACKVNKVEVLSHGGAGDHGLLGTGAHEDGVVIRATHAATSIGTCGTIAVSILVREVVDVILGVVAPGWVVRGLAAVIGDLVRMVC